MEPPKKPAERLGVWRSTAQTPGRPGYPDRNGRGITVLGPLAPSAFDADEVGPMFRVRFADGVEADAYADEIELEEEGDAVRSLAGTTDNRCTTCHRDAHRPGTGWQGHGHAYTGPGR